MAFDGANIWVTGDTYTYEFRDSDGFVLALYRVVSGSTGIAFDGAYMWAADTLINSVAKF